MSKRDEAVIALHRAVNAARAYHLAAEKELADLSERFRSTIDAIRAAMEKP